jgi:hypothetical protein
MRGAALPSPYTLPARPARSFFIDENKSPDGPFLWTKSIQETPWKSGIAPRSRSISTDVSETRILIHQELRADP